MIGTGQALTGHAIIKSLYFLILTRRRGDKKRGYVNIPEHQ